MTKQPRGARSAALLLAAAFVLVACTVDEELTEAERALFVTEADFQPFGLTKAAGPAGKYRKTRYRFDGSFELVYVIDSDDPGFYLSHTLTIDSTAASALLTEKAQKVGMMIGLKATGIDETELTLHAKYGDSSSLAVLTKDGKPIGNVFTAVSGRAVVALIFSGIYFDDPAQFHEVISAKVDAIFKYGVAHTR